MNQRKGYIISEISHKGGVRLGKNSYSRMKSPFSRGVGPSGSCLRSCLIIPNFHTSRCPIRAQLLDPLFTNSLYWVHWAQIPVHHWAQPENRDPTHSFKPSITILLKFCHLSFLSIFFLHNFFWMKLFFFFSEKKKIWGENERKISFNLIEGQNNLVVTNHKISPCNIGHFVLGNPCHPKHP